MPAIRRVVLFGSLVRGVPTPRSDADLLIVVDASDSAHVRDRLPAILAALSPLPCPVDVVVLTMDELRRAQDGGDPLVREALEHGVDLLS
jgi:predicted nucleotidyltransferase